MAAVASEFGRVACVTAILTAIFAALHCGAGAGGMCALALVFHNSPHCLRLDALGGIERVPVISERPFVYSTARKTGEQ